MNVMASGQISAAAIKYIDLIFTGASKEKLEKSIKEGKIILENLKFKESFFENFSLLLPFKVLNSQVKSIEVEVPWSKLTSKSVEIVIDTIDLNLLFDDSMIFDKEIRKKFEEIFFTKLSKDLIKCIEKMHDELEKTFADKKDSAFLANMIKNMIKSITDNLRIKLKNINFRLFNNLKKLNNSDMTSKTKNNIKNNDNNNNVSEINVQINQQNQLDILEFSQIKEFIHFRIEELEYFNADKNYNLLVFDDKNKKSETFYKLISIKGMLVNYYNKQLSIKDYENLLNIQSEESSIDLLNLDESFYSKFTKFQFIELSDFGIKLNYILPKANEFKTIFKTFIDIPKFALNIPNSINMNLLNLISQIRLSLDVIKNTINFNINKYPFIFEADSYKKKENDKKIFDMHYESDFLNDDQIIKNRKEKLKFLFCFILHKIKQKKNEYLLVKTQDKEIEEEIKKEFFTLIQNRVFKRTNNDEKKDTDLLLKIFSKKLKFINQDKLMSWIGNLLESNLQRIKTEKKLKLDQGKEKAKIIELMEKNMGEFTYFSQLKFLNDYKKSEVVQDPNMPNSEENVKSASKVDVSDKSIVDSIKDNLNNSKIIKFLRENDLSLEIDVKEFNFALIKTSSNDLDLWENLNIIYQQNQKESSILNIENERCMKYFDKNYQQINIMKFREIFLKKLCEFSFDKILDVKEQKEIRNLAFLQSVKSSFLNEFSFEKYHHSNSFFNKRLDINIKQFNFKIRLNPKKAEMNLTLSDYQILLINTSKEKFDKFNCNRYINSKNQLVITDFKKSINSNNQSNQINNNDNEIPIIDNLNSFELKFEFLFENLFDEKVNLKKDLLDILSIQTEHQQVNKNLEIDLGSFKIVLGGKQLILHNELLFFLKDLNNNNNLLNELDRNKKVYISRLSNLFSKNSQIDNKMALLKNNMKDFSSENIIKYYNIILNYYKQFEEKLLKLMPKNLMENLPHVKFEMEYTAGNIDLIYPFNSPFKNYKKENLNKFLIINATKAYSKFLFCSSKLEIFKEFNSFKISIFDDYIIQNKPEENNYTHTFHKLLFNEDYQAFKMDLLNLNKSSFSTIINFSDISENFILMDLKIEDVQFYFNKFFLATLDKLNSVTSSNYRMFPLTKFNDYEKNFENSLKNINNKIENVQVQIPTESFEKFQNQIDSLSVISEVLSLESNKFYECLIITTENMSYLYYIELNIIIPFSLNLKAEDNFLIKDSNSSNQKNGNIVELNLIKDDIKILFRNSPLIKNANENENSESSSINKLFEYSSGLVQAKKEISEKSLNKKSNVFSIDILEGDKNELMNKFSQYLKIVLDKVCDKKISIKLNINNIELNLINIIENSLNQDFTKAEFNKDLMKFEFNNLFNANIENLSSNFIFVIKREMNSILDQNKTNLNLSLSYNFTIDNVYSFIKNNRNVFFEFKDASLNKDINNLIIENNASKDLKDQAININLIINKLIEIDLIRIRNLLISNEEEIKDDLDLNSYNILSPTKNIGKPLEEINIETKINFIMRDLFNLQNIEKKFEFLIQKDFNFFYDSYEIFNIIRFLLDIKFNKKKNQLYLQNKLSNFYKDNNLNVSNINLFNNTEIKRNTVNENKYTNAEFLVDLIAALNFMEMRKTYIKQKTNFSSGTKGIEDNIFNKETLIKLIDNFSTSLSFKEINIYLINNKLETYFCKMTLNKLFFTLRLKMKSNLKSLIRMENMWFSCLDKFEIDTGFENLNVCDTTNYPYYSDLNDADNILNNEIKFDENKELDLLTINDSVILNLSFAFNETDTKHILQNGKEILIKHEIISNLTFNFPTMIINYLYQPFKRFQRYLDYESKKFMKIEKINNKLKNRILNQLKNSEHYKLYESFNKLSNQISDSVNIKTLDSKHFDFGNDLKNFCFNMDMNFKISNCIVYLDDRCKNGDKLKFTFNNISCEKNFENNFIIAEDNDRFNFESNLNSNTSFNLLDNINAGLKIKDTVSKEKKEFEDINQINNFNSKQINDKNNDNNNNENEKPKIKLDEIKIKMKKFDISILTQTLLSAKKRELAKVSEVEMNLFIPFEAIKTEILKSQKKKNNLNSTYNLNRKKSIIKNLNESFFSRTSKKLIEEDPNLNLDTIYFEISLNEGVKINLQKEDLHSMFNIFINNIMFKDKREHLFKFTLDDENLKTYKDKNTSFNNSNFNFNFNTSVNESEIYLKTDEEEINHDTSFDFKFKNNDFLYLYSFEVKCFIPFISLNLINDAKFYQYFPTDELIDLSSELKITNFYFMYLKKKEKTLSRTQEFKITFDEIELIFLNEKLFTNSKLLNNDNSSDASPFRIDVEYLIKNSNFTFEDDLKYNNKGANNPNAESIDKKTFNFKEESIICRVKLESLNFFLRYDLIVLFKSLLDKMFSKNSFKKLKQKPRKFITEIDLRPNQTLLELNIKDNNFIFLSENLKNKNLSKSAINNLTNLDQKVINLNVESTNFIYKYSQFFETKQMNKIFSYITEFQQMKKQKVCFLNPNHKNEIFISNNKIRSFQNVINNIVHRYYVNDNDLLKKNKNLKSYVKYYNYIDIDCDLFSFLKTNFDIMSYMENIELQIIKLAEKYYVNNSLYDVNEDISYQKLPSSKRLIMSKERKNYLNLNIRKNIILGGQKNDGVNKDILQVENTKNILEFFFDVGNFEFKLSYRDILSIIDVLNYNVKFQENEEFMNLLEYIKVSSYTEDMDEFFNSKDKNLIFNDKVVVKGINDRSAIYNLSERARKYLANEKSYQGINFLEFKFNINEFKFTLIDDHSDTYYPFLSIRNDNIDCSLLIDQNPKIKTPITIESKISFEFLNYNHLAGQWEPLIEKFFVILNFAQVQQTFENENKILYNFEINAFDPESSVININLSDINIPHLYVFLYNWIDNLLKRLNNPSLRINDEEDLKIISNHRFFNYTGEEILINTNKDNRKLAIKLNPDEFKDLELISDFNYESETEILSRSVNNSNKKGFESAFVKEKTSNKNSLQVIFFLSEKKYSNNQYQDNNISIDKNGIKQHYIKYNSTQNNFIRQLESYQYIISEVTCSRLKRHVYLYSPLIFHNKTRKTLILEFIKKQVSISSKNQEESYTLIIESQAKVGVPIQYLDSLILVNNENTLYNENHNHSGSNFIDINSVNFNNSAGSNKKDNFLDVEEIMSKNFFFKELKLNNFILNFHRKQNKNINFLREIKINNAYSVKNYLPFDITISSKSLEKPIILAKSEKVSIDGLSFSKPLEVFLQISDFSTREPIVIQPFNDFEHVNRLHLDSNKVELDNFSNLMKRKFAQNSNANLPNNLKTVKLYHKNYQQNNLTLEVSGIIYFKYTNFHIELVFLSTNVIVNETGLDNMRLFYSQKREIGMPICFVKNSYENSPPKEYSLNDLHNSDNCKCIYRVFNNSEGKFFINVFDCESSSINIIDDIKPGQPIIATCKSKSKQYEFVISINYTYVTSEMRKTDNQVDLLCKVITIKPRTIIINELEMFSVDLCLEKDKNLNERPIKQKFLPNSKNPFYFFNDFNSLNNSLCLKIEPFIACDNPIINETPHEINSNNLSLNPYSGNQISENDYSTGLIYDWSRPIIMRYQGLITIPITYDYLDFNQNTNNANNADKKKQKFYLNIDIKYVDLNMIIIFSEATYENTQFLIENNLDDILVRVFQYKYEGINDESIQPKNYIYEAQNEFEKIYEDKDKKYNKSIFSIIDYLSNSNNTNNCLGIEFYKYENKNKNLNNLGHIDYSNCYLQKLTKSIFYYSICENKILNHSNGKTYEYPIIDEVELEGNNILIFIETKGMKKTITFEPKNKAHSESLSPTMLNTSISLQIDLQIKNIGISIISDNIFHDRKHRNYNRNEILFVLLSDISFFFKKDSKLSLNYDEGELRVSLGNLKIDNMASTHDKCRFPNLLCILDDNNDENYNNPFFDLSVFSQIHVFDKISKITYLNYYLKTIKIAFDTDLIEEIIFFANNITYRLKSSFIDIHKIFKDYNTMGKELDMSSNNNTNRIFSLNKYNIHHSKLNLNNNFNLLKEQREKISISQIEQKNTLNYSSDSKIKKNILNVNNLSEKKYVKINNINLSINNENQINLNKNDENSIKLYQNNYFKSIHPNDSKNAKEHVYYFNTLEISNLKIILSMSSRNIQGFLNKYFNLGGFLSGMISHILKSDENKINLKGAKIENYSGTIKETLSTIINSYRQSSFKVFVGLSAKGFLEGFLQLFKNDLQDYRNNYLLRTRIPRPLYGDFYYIKKYDNTDALVVDLIKNKKLKIHENFHLKSMKLLKCEKLTDELNREYYFIMTTKNLIIYSKTYESCVDIFEYIFIESSIAMKDNILYIKFNQDIDGANFFNIKCKGRNECTRISNYLNYYLSEYKQEYYK